MIKSKTSKCGIRKPGCITTERMISECGIIIPGCIIIERLTSECGIRRPACIRIERTISEGGIIIICSVIRDTCLISEESAIS